MARLDFVIGATMLALAFISNSPVTCQRPIIRGYTMLLGNCAEMYLNEKPMQLDVQSCGNECQRYTGCRGFSFDYLAQHCWLKWGLCDRVKPTRTTPVIFYKNELWGFTAEKGSCPGQLAVPPIFSDVVDCASQCREMANCSGFTYDFEGDVCYLKAQVCSTTMPSEALAVESWVKYFKKDFWVPAALERTRKALGDGADDDGDSVETNRMMTDGDTTNPLEMVFFDNNNAPVTLNHHTGSSSDKGDPWEAYSNPSDGSDYVAVSEDMTRILIHRTTIANASEHACSRACSVDPHCAYFYLHRVEVVETAATAENNAKDKSKPANVTNNSSNNKLQLATSKSNSSASGAKPAANNEQPNNGWLHQGQVVATMTKFRQNCVLFSKWNGSSSSSSHGKRRRPDEGKLFQKVAHAHYPTAASASSSSTGNNNELDDQLNLAQPTDSTSAHHVTLLSLRKRKRHIGIDESAEEADHDNLMAPRAGPLTNRGAGTLSSSITSSLALVSSLILVIRFYNIDNEYRVG